MMKYVNDPVSVDLQRQQLSALMDGELDMPQTKALLQSHAEHDDLLQVWSSYQAIGDALRAHAADQMNRSAGSVLTAVASTQGLDNPAKVAANDSVFRWKMVASVAAVAAIGSVLWSLVGLQSAATGTQLAQQSAPPVVNSMVTRAASPANDNVVMLRDPRLDEFLAAHKQFGGASALQQPAGFLRNATFQATGR